MEISKVISDGEKPQSRGLCLTTEEKKRLVDFFAVLIEIDRRENVTKTYDKPIK
jgi:hypothetical protein